MFAAAFKLDWGLAILYKCLVLAESLDSCCFVFFLVWYERAVQRSTTYRAYCAKLLL